MLIKNVLNCSFSQWFHKFSHISIESEVMKISTQFTDYLLSDGIILPKSCLATENTSIYTEWSAQSDDSQSSGEDDSIDFPELDQNMKIVLSRFGPVFPKLNWSSCQDSKWITTSGTRCFSTHDIFLLLKSSDNIVHDLTEPFKFCEDFDEENIPCVEYELILRKWVDINPSMEFRCFIANDTIIGITQRDVRSYFYHINQQKEDITVDIRQFFTNNIKGKFFDMDFVIDVYRPNSGRIVLIDINPFGETTDSLLFDWDELNAMRDNIYSDEEPEFRYLTNETGIQSQSYALNSLPIDVNNGYNLQDLLNDGRIER